MTPIVKPVRVEPAFDDRESVRELFHRHAPYLAAAAYLPDGSDDTGEPRPIDAVLPWFRGTWALGGEARVTGVEPLLRNPRFIAAAQAMFPHARIVPKTVVVNVNAPMPAGVPHVDVPSFHGATRESFALRLLIAMGASGLFEQWRVVEAGAISWFYAGPGGAFDYWPEGPHGPMLTERPPFGNLAIIADNDRMYHRIGQIGDVAAPLPRMSAAAVIRPADAGWEIIENEALRARYPQEAVRLSVLWKAEAVCKEQRAACGDDLNPSRIVELLQCDLHRRGMAITLPEDPLADVEWIAAVYGIYTRTAKAAAPREH
jgi:hypothetical protein